MSRIIDGIRAVPQKRKMQSRKLWVALLTSAAVVACSVLKVDLSPVQCAAVVAPAVAYILGESFADGGGGDHLPQFYPAAGRAATEQPREHAGAAG